MTKLLLATLAAAIVSFLADFLWFGVIFKDYYQSVMPTEGTMNMGMHGVAELVWALLLAIIYPIGFKGGSAINEGIKFGILMGLVVSAPGMLHLYADGGGNMKFVLFMIGHGVILGILAGITVAMVYGKKKAATD